MLDQIQADALMAMEKRFVDHSTLVFPIAGEMRQWKVQSADRRESFLIDVNRKGRIRVSKCTYQERYQVVEILVRLDIDGPAHENPDGAVVPCPHIHLYRESFGDKWAFPLPSGRFTDTPDLVKTLSDFLAFCNVRDIPTIQRGVL